MTLIKSHLGTDSMTNYSSKYGTDIFSMTLFKRCSDTDIYFVTNDSLRDIYAMILFFRDA